LHIYKHNKIKILEKQSHENIRLKKVSVRASIYLRQFETLKVHMII